MTNKKRYRKQIESHMKSIAKHLENIALEKNKSNPDNGKIRHWEAEIRTFRNEIIKGSKINNLVFFACRFRLNLFNLIESNRMRILSCVEDSRIEDWAKSV